ncbi:MAG: pilus assembly protein PilZ [Geobacteraceae bacterium GWC2_55_20]|nr:MAG: pilus assembly protein PilZ [Geobacteraceae bacterium GWC2_55_20]OGU23175.1 MAG: pilus assembly protein PilZ [Geobacteraceae bacterium GWF2_54_21]HBA73017.1 PilZ domain-containing protein [Geobacter sp.]
MFQYYDKAVRGTENEDKLVILQFLSGMIGQTFSFLNYYKEIPVSYDSTLLSVENEMAEFAIHEYQAKVISLERKALIYSHAKSPYSEDMIGEAFYVNSVRKRAILCNFAYARIRSDMRRFVRVQLDHPVEVDLVHDDDILKGNVKDISLGGAAMSVMDSDRLVPGSNVGIVLKLPDSQSNSVVEVEAEATIVKITGESAPFSCIIEIHSDKHSQQQIAHYINQRQVEIIRELKDINA